MCPKHISVIFAQKNKKKGCGKVAQYIITDGSRFIYQNHYGKYVPTPSEAMADIYSKDLAEKICNNSLSKALRTVFYIEKYDNPPDDIKQVTKDDLENNTEKVMISENIQKWLDKVSELNGLCHEASKRKDELLKQLSSIDKELSDIEHYIEFCNLNAAQGYKAYKMIKERRIKRRSIKNELAVLNIILNKKIGDSIADEIIEAVAKLDKRTYEPKVLQELYDL